MSVSGISGISFSNSEAMNEYFTLLDTLTKYGNNPEGIPPILYAAEKGDLDAVKLLIKHGADIQTRDSGPGRHSALHYALFSKNHELIEFLLKNGLNPNDGYLEWRNSMILDDAKSFELLIQFGLHLNSTDYTNTHIGNCPSLSAISYGSLNILKLILKNGGDLPRECIDIPDLIFWVASSRSEGDKKKLECVKWLIDSGFLDLSKKDFKEHHDTISNTYPEFLEYIIDKGYLRVNETLNHGGFPIHYANTRPDLLKVLLNRGADINSKHTKGYNRTILHSIAGVNGWYKNYLESIKMLLSHGANVNALDDFGRTPLFYAKDPEIKRLLIEHGAILKGT